MELGTLVVRLTPVLVALALATLIETLVPLRQQSRRLHGRLSTNLALLGITLGLGMLLNFALAIGAAYVVRFSFIAATAWLLGAPPVAVAVYRLPGSLNAVLEHANLRVPHWFDRVLVLVWVTPHMDKIHHSRERAETDSNYANLFSFFDRAFGTYTPSSRGTSVAYGINGFDAPEHQSLAAVLWLPFRRASRLVGESSRAESTPAR